MTQSEVVTLRIDIRNRWRHGEIQTVDQYHADLNRFPAHQVKACVDSLYASGERYAPSGAAIIRKLAELSTDAPDWYAVLHELRARQGASGRRSAATIGRVCPANQCDGSGWAGLDAEGNVIRFWETFEKPAASAKCQCHEQLLREAAERRTTHWLVAAFLTQIEQRDVVDALNGDRVAEAQLRTKYEAYVNDVQSRLTHAHIEPAGLAKLERLAVESGRHGQLHRPDVAGELGDAAA